MIALDDLPSSPMQWEDANTAAENYSVQGLEDWELPNNSTLSYMIGSSDTLERINEARAVHAPPVVGGAMRAGHGKFCLTDRGL